MHKLKHGIGRLKIARLPPHMLSRFLAVICVLKVIMIIEFGDHPFFKQFYHGPKGIYIDSPRYKEIEALEKPNIQITRANHYGNTPRRAYTIRKTVTRIQCRYIGGTYLLINQKQYNYDTIYY